MLRVLDSYAEILRTFSGQPFSLGAWRPYAEKISAALPRKCLADAEKYDFLRQVKPVLDFACAHPAQMEAAHESFLAAVETLSERIRARFAVDLDADILFYLGLCSGAGWATELDGRPAVLLGAEKIVELNWTGKTAMCGLLYHELGHLWHSQCRKAPSFEKTAPALWQLYTEGIAMFFEQELAGGPDFFHQDRDGWLSWCRENEGELFREFWRRCKAGESVQDFFGDWCSYRGHSDIGYFLGAVLARNLSAAFGVRQLCDCTEQEAIRALQGAAERNS